MTGSETVTDSDTIRDAINNLLVGDIVYINDQRLQRVESIAPISVFVAGHWVSAATYELHENRWGEHPVLHPTDLQRRIIEGSVEVRELTVERPTALAAWL